MSVMNPVMQTARTSCMVWVQFVTISKVEPQIAQKFNLHWKSEAKKNDIDHKVTRSISPPSR